MYLGDVANAVKESEMCHTKSSQYFIRASVMR